MATFFHELAKTIFFQGLSPLALNKITVGAQNVSLAPILKWFVHTTIQLQVLDYILSQV